MREQGYDNQQTIQIMTEQLKKYFPEGDFKVFNDGGVSCIVFENLNDPSKLYKVYRLNYANSISHAREEYEKGKRLHDQGDNLGPKMIDLVESEPPFLVMEKIEGDFAFKNQIIEARNQLFSIFLKLKLAPGDIEFLWDEKNHRIRVIDVFSLTDRSDLSVDDLAQLINTELDSIIRTDGRLK